MWYLDEKGLPVFNGSGLVPVVADWSLWYCNGQWVQYGIIPWHSETLIIDKIPQRATFPGWEHLQWAQVIISNETFWLVGYVTIFPSSLSQWRACLDVLCHTQIVRLESSDSDSRKFQKIASNLWNRQGFAISNGSFTQERGVAAWIIKGSNGENHLIGICVMPSQPNNQSSVLLWDMWVIQDSTNTSLFGSATRSSRIFLACNRKLALHQVFLLLEFRIYAASGLEFGGTTPILSKMVSDLVDTC